MPLQRPFDAYERAVRRTCAVLIAIALGLALINLSYLPHESVGSPNVPAPAAPGAPATPPPVLSFPRQVLRLGIHQLDLDREGNFTTWYASVQLALAGAVALVLSRFRRRRGWIAVGGALLALSLDELAQLHEWVGTALWSSDWRLGFVVPPYPWLLVVGPPLILFALWMLRFTRREFGPEPRLARLTLVALACMAAALPLELLGGRFEATSGRLLRLTSTAEETGELIGGTLLLYVALMWLGRSLPALRESLDVWSGLERSRRAEAEAARPGGLGPAPLTGTPRRGG